MARPRHRNALQPCVLSACMVEYSANYVTHSRIRCQLARKRESMDFQCVVRANLRRILQYIEALNRHGGSDAAQREKLQPNVNACSDVSGVTSLYYGRIDLQAATSKIPSFHPMTLFCAVEYGCIPCVSMIYTFVCSLRPCGCNYLQAAVFFHVSMTVHLFPFLKPFEAAVITSPRTTTQCTLKHCFCSLLLCVACLFCM